MNKPPTKEKGDTGLVQVMADLYSKGYKVALPVSEHMPFDLIAISPDSKLAKISVKYREMKKNGTIEVPLRTVFYNSKGARARRVDLNEIDGFAIYCPNNKTCYYVNSEKLSSYSSIMSLRITHTTGKGSDPIVWAKDFTDVNIINFR